MSLNNYGLPSPLTAQAIFDKAATHLLQQGRRSLAEDRLGTGDCAYRGSHGTACALGALISDDNYSEHMEGRNSHQLVEEFLPELAPFEVLLSALQRAHDNRLGEYFDIADMKFSLRHIANRFGLSAAVLDAAQPAQPWSPPLAVEQTLPEEITRLLAPKGIERVEG